LIHAEHLRHAYAPGPPVLDVPHLHVPAGGRLLVLGRSGSGKSTLLHVLAGLLRPQAGRVEVDGQDLAALAEAELDRFRGQKIGIVFQRLHLFETLTVRENLRTAQFLAGVPQDEDRVREVLDRVDLLEKGGAYPSTLSQGQRQRVVLARAVVNRPALLLADEPTSSLDDVRAEAVMDLLEREAGAAGAALVVATHDARIRDRFADVLTLGEVRGPKPEVQDRGVSSRTSPPEGDREANL
jgi:putative ABC transport system ATP-binding protein